MANRKPYSWVPLAVSLLVVGLGLILVALGMRTASATTTPEASLAPTVSDEERLDEFLTKYPGGLTESLPTWPALPTDTLVPTAADAPGPVRGDTEYGIQIHGCGPYDLDLALDLAAEAGFTWVKQQVRWEEIEGELDQYSWDCLDRVVGGAETRNLKVLLSVTTTPAWARSSAEDLHPSHPNLVADFCRQMVLRYRGRVHAVEVWNEPNLQMEWGPYMDPKEYSEMLEWTYWAIKYNAPEVMVISAALAPTQWSAWDVAVPDDVFLSDLVANGGLESADCIGVHYNHGTESPLVAGGQFDQLIWSYSEITSDRLPLCVTELGFAVPRGNDLPQGFEWAASNTAKDQAQWLADGWQWAEAHPGVLRLVSVFNLDYWSDDPDDVNALYALWTPGGMMPAFNKLAEANSWVMTRK
jgi:hypothetical protein